MERSHYAKPLDDFHGDTIRATVSRNLRELLKAHGISQVQLHRAVVASAVDEQAKLSLRAIKNYLAVEPIQSSTNPSINTLQEIARGLRFLGLDVTEAWIVCRHDYQVLHALNTSNQLSSTLELKHYIHTFIESLEQLTPEHILINSPGRDDVAYQGALIDIVSKHITAVFNPDYSVAAITLVLEILQERKVEQPANNGRKKLG